MYQLPIEFDGIAILLALLFYRQSAPEHERTAFCVLCFFVVSEVVYQRFFLDIRSQNNWLIFILYNVINTAVCYKLHQLKSHLIILLTILLNVLLNIVVSFNTTSDLVGQIVYTSYSYIAAALMLVCLWYMWSIKNGNRILERLADSKSKWGILFRPNNGMVF